ncbi:MAG: hypothetical protein R6X25_10475 [Candidatus Krumholzibacteriia bacterium]
MVRSPARQNGSPFRWLLLFPALFLTVRPAGFVERLAVPQSVWDLVVGILGGMMYVPAVVCVAAVIAPKWKTGVALLTFLGVHALVGAIYYFLYYSLGVGLSDILRHTHWWQAVPLVVGSLLGLVIVWSAPKAKP